MRKLFLLCIAVLSFTLAANAQDKQEEKDLFVQFSTYQALSTGLYQGFFDVNDVMKQGNHGIGTFEGLDGEMVMIDGELFQVKADGTANFVMDTAKIPYAAVTFFSPEIETRIKPGTSWQDIQKDILKALPSKNMFYAIRIEGKFKFIMSRSVPKQDTPYPLLLDVIGAQKSYKFLMRSAVMVGFYCPSYVGVINTPGFHLHFISKDKKSGGHVLDFTTSDKTTDPVATIKIDKKTSLNLILPDKEAFNKADLSIAETEKKADAVPAAAPVVVPPPKGQNAPARGPAAPAAPAK